MARWANFTDPDGTVYDLRHLDDGVAVFRLPATILRPDTDVSVSVSFSRHCFTRTPKEGEAVAPEMIYENNREGRAFCPHRWEFSKDLPRIVSTLLERNCFDADKKNHVLFSSAQSAAGVEYAVFFVLKVAPQGADVDANLMIQSAHTRSGYRPGGKPTKFKNLLRDLGLEKTKPRR